MSQQMLPCNAATDLARKHKLAQPAAGSNRDYPDLGSYKLAGSGRKFCWLGQQWVLYTLRAGGYDRRCSTRRSNWQLCIRCIPAAKLRVPPFGPPRLNQMLCLCRLRVFLHVPYLPYLCTYKNEIHIFGQAYIHTLYKQITDIQTYRHTRIYSYANTCAHTHTHARTHARTHTYTYTHIHIHTHTYTHIHIHTYII